MSDCPVSGYAHRIGCTDCAAKAERERLEAQRMDVEALLIACERFHRRMWEKYRDPIARITLDLISDWRDRREGRHGGTNGAA